MLEKIINIFSPVSNIIDKIHNNKKIQFLSFVLYFVGLTGLIVLRDFFAFNINKFLFLILIMVCTLLLSRQRAYFIIFFTLPFISSLAELYMLCFALFYMFLCSFRQRKLMDWIVLFAFPILLLILEVVLSYFYGTISLKVALRIFVLLSILSIIYYDRKDFTKELALAFVCGCLFMFFIMGINYFVQALYAVSHNNPNSYAVDLQLIFKNVRFGGQVADWTRLHGQIVYPKYMPEAIAENPNNVGLLSLTCLACCYVQFPTLKIRGKISTIIMMMLFVLFGLWSESRTFMLLFVVFIILFIVVTVLSKRLSVVDGAIYLCVVLLIGSVVMIFAQKTIFSLISRFFEGTTSGAGGRVDLLKLYLSFTFSNVKYALFGVSCTNLMSYTGIWNVPHTNIVQFLGAYGLLPLLFLLVLLVFSFIKEKRKINFLSTDLYLFIPILSTILFTFTLQLFSPSVVLISFVPGVLFVSFLNKSNEKEILFIPNKPLPVKTGEKCIIAMCAESFGGGAGSYIRNLSSNFDSDEISSTFVFNPDTKEKEVERYSAIKKQSLFFEKKQSKIFIVRILRKFSYYRKCFKQINPNIIYINSSSYKRSFILILAAKMQKTSVKIIHCHRAVYRNQKLPFFEKILRFIVLDDLMFHFSCSVESGKVYYEKKYPKLTSDYVVKNFIDTQAFIFTKNNRDIIRRKLHVSNSDILLGNVGRLADVKNQLFLINLLKLLPNNYKLVILGSGPLLSELNTKIEENMIQDRVILVPETKDVAMFYSGMDFFLLPSKREGLPFACVEAQCSGLLCIISNIIPQEVVVGDNVLSLDLDLQTWCNVIKRSVPIKLEDRQKYADVVKAAGYSFDGGPQIVISEILELYRMYTTETHKIKQKRIKANG